MPPDNRVAAKLTDCLSDYCNLNNRTLGIVNDISLIRMMATCIALIWNLYTVFSLLGCKLSMMLVTYTALRAFNFLIDGDVKLKIPDFVVHQLNLENANAEASNDETELWNIYFVIELKLRQSILILIINLVLFLQRIDGV